MPANNAQLKMLRNGGARRSERMMSSTIGSRFSRVILNSPASVAWAAARSKVAPSPTPSRPRTVNSTTAMRMAGPDVQIMAPTCCWTVTPPTIEGTRTVVSDSGVILSPK